MEVPVTVINAFADFLSDSSLFTLPLSFEDNILQPSSPIPLPKDPGHSFQQSLDQLQPVLDSTTGIYLLLRHEDSLIAITYVPYTATSKIKALLLDNRHILINKLGKDHFASSLICKEVGEITDKRSWDERSGQGHSWGSEPTNIHEKVEGGEDSFQDLGHKKNNCRLCDRRMKNRINQDALEALKGLAEDGACVQLSVNTTTETLQLNLSLKDFTPAEVATCLPTEKSSFTFYQHPSHHRSYFIFCSPDSATVKERMMHTMAIPGLVNVIAKNNGVNVDQKIEIHDPEDLAFEVGDARIGKFRSMYLRNKIVHGTESRWEGMEEQQRVLDVAR